MALLFLQAFSQKAFKGKINSKSVFGLNVNFSVSFGFQLGMGLRKINLTQIYRVVSVHYLTFSPCHLLGSELDAV